MSDAPLSRRRFLISLLAGALTVSGCRRSVALPDDHRPSLPGWVAEPALDFDAAARIGRAYLSTHPQEGDAQRLVDSLEGTVAAHSGADTDPLRALGRAARKEYSQGDYVQVQGWILSRSEARLYALIALVVR